MHSYDAIGSFEKKVVTCNGAGTAMMQPIFDNQVRIQNLPKEIACFFLHCHDSFFLRVLRRRSASPLAPMLNIPPMRVLLVARGFSLFLSIFFCFTPRRRISLPLTGPAMFTSRFPPYHTQKGRLVPKLGWRRQTGTHPRAGHRPHERRVHFCLRASYHSW